MKSAASNAEKHCIVIAWTDMGGMRATGRMVRFDGYNYRPEFVPCLAPHAAVWLNAGTDEDAAKARAYAEAEGFDNARVYEYATSERDPLTRARREVHRSSTTHETRSDASLDAPNPLTSRKG